MHHLAARCCVHAEAVGGRGAERQSGGGRERGRAESTRKCERETGGVASGVGWEESERERERDRERQVEREGGRERYREGGRE